jgi:hypothetical protein
MRASGRPIPKAGVKGSRAAFRDPLSAAGAASRLATEDSPPLNSAQPDVANANAEMTISLIKNPLRNSRQVVGVSKMWTQHE